MPTGAGKSVCYQLPALISENFSIVISPLIALMKDQVDNLNKKSEVSAFINSTMDLWEAEDVLQKISFGKIKLLYLAPERLESKKFADKLAELRPNFLFVDEAHCISEWGHNFRPSYAKISEFIDYCSIKKVASFTATATPKVVEDISIQLKLKEPKIFVKGFERENLKLNVQLSVKKKLKILELLTGISGTAIIYTSSRKKAEEVADFLTLKGISCGYYHAGLQAIERKKIQENFINDEIRVISATNAFGMGIDKRNIRLIIHYNVPGSIENYYQEIGRAGRDNLDSAIHLLYDDNDTHIQNYFISNSHPTKEFIQKVYSAINDFNQIAIGSLPDNEIIVDQDYISNYTGTTITRGLLHASLKFLENAGYIKRISDFEKKDSLQIIFAKKKLEEFVRRTTNAELKNSVLILLREYGSEIFNTQKQISIAQLSKLIGIEEDDLYDSLTTLDNLGIVSFTPSIQKETIYLSTPRIEKERLQLNYKKINESYLNARQKFDDMIDYVHTNDCRFKFILSYFGEEVEDYKCGMCDNCTASDRIADSSVEYISDIILNTITEADSPLPESSLIKIVRGEKEKNSFANFEYFGTASNYSNAEIKIILQNMFSKKLLSKTSGKNNYLELTDGGLNKAGRDKPVEKPSSNYDKRLELYHTLRQVRKRASDKFLQTQYLLCPDEVLKEVVKRIPRTKAALLGVEGFNNRMFNKIGNDILEAITRYSEEEESTQNEIDIPQNIKETYNLLSKKYTLKEISQLRKLSEAIISMQIETILEYYPESEIDFLFDVKSNERIKEEIKKGYSSLKELKERLPSNISYAQIRITAAKNKFTPQH
jgi:ATP-dependent DNA helicase RecQ